MNVVWVKNPATACRKTASPDLNPATALSKQAENRGKSGYPSAAQEPFRREISIMLGMETCLSLNTTAFVMALGARVCSLYRVLSIFFLFVSKYLLFPVNFLFVYQYLLFFVFDYLSILAFLLSIFFPIVYQHMFFFLSGRSS